MGDKIIQFEIFLLLVSFIAVLCQKFKVPYTVGLVVSGLGLAMLPIHIGITLSKELLFNLILPPLIFEATLFLPWSHIKKDLPLTIGIATIGIILATIVTMYGLHLLSSWPLLTCAIFAVLISATDPVSVIASFKEFGVKGRVRYLLEAESLFNDGSAAVLFTTLLGIYAGGGISYPHILGSLLVSILGAIILGIVLGMLFIVILRSANDHLLSISFTTIAAFSSFLIAEELHLSGIISTLCCGLTIGNLGIQKSFITTKTRDSLQTYWEYVAFLVNSVVFLLIGVSGVGQNYHTAFGLYAGVIVITLVARGVSVYGFLWIFTGSSRCVKLNEQHVMVWGGLRGGLALALSLGLPLDFPHRESIITLTFAVVAFSVIVQGLTMSKLLTYFKIK